MLALLILSIAEVSVIEPVLMFLYTVKSLTSTELAAPIVYKSSRVLLNKVSLVIVMFDVSEKKKKSFLSFTTVTF